LLRHLFNKMSWFSDAFEAGHAFCKDIWQVRRAE